MLKIVHMSNNKRINENWNKQINLKILNLVSTLKIYK